MEYAQSWTALFRAFSSHRQPSAIFFKGIPSWTNILAQLANLMGLHRGRCLVGNKRFFTCGTLETSEKSLDPCSKHSHRLSLLQGLPSAWLPSASVQAHKVCQLGQDVCSAGNTFEKDSWGLPMRAKSSKQRCPALCILDLSYNVKYHWSCRVGGCYGHLTASGSWHGFPGVDHEGRQDIAIKKEFRFVKCILIGLDLIFISKLVNRVTH